MRKNVGGLPRRRIKKSEPWQLFATFRPLRAWANSKASSLLRDNRCAAKPEKKLCFPQFVTNADIRLAVSRFCRPCRGCWW